MKHFVFTMAGQDTAPAGGGTTEGWFFHYKWDVDGEAFVPVPDTLEAPAPGDLLWFVLDDLAIGYVLVLRVVEDSINDKHEIHYDTRKLHDARKQKQIRTKQKTGLVTDASGVAFFDTLKLNFTANFPARDARGAQAARPAQTQTQPKAPTTAGPKGPGKA